MLDVVENEALNGDKNRFVWASASAIFRSRDVVLVSVWRTRGRLNCWFFFITSVRLKRFPIVTLSELSRVHLGSCSPFTWRFQQPHCYGKGNGSFVDHVWTNFRGLSNIFQMIFGSNGSSPDNFRNVLGWSEILDPKYCQTDLQTIWQWSQYHPGFPQGISDVPMSVRKPHQVHERAQFSPGGGGAPVARLSRAPDEEAKGFTTRRVASSSLEFRKKCAGSFGIWLPCPWNRQAIPSHLTHESSNRALGMKCLLWRGHLHPSPLDVSPCLQERSSQFHTPWHTENNGRKFSKTTHNGIRKQWKKGSEGDASQHLCFGNLGFPFCFADPLLAPRNVYTLRAQPDTLKKVEDLSKKSCNLKLKLQLTIGQKLIT